jgi:hypothetical protein
MRRIIDVISITTKEIGIRFIPLKGALGIKTLLSYTL